MLILAANFPYLITSNFLPFSDTANKFHDSNNVYSGNKNKVASVELGIANGTKVTITKIIFQENTEQTEKILPIGSSGKNMKLTLLSKRPLYLIAKFIDPKQAKLFRNFKKKHGITFDGLIPENSLGRDEFPLSEEDSSAQFLVNSSYTLNYKIKQFNLIPAAAITGHKIQGFTAENLIIISNMNSKQKSDTNQATTSEWDYTVIARSKILANQYNCFPLDENYCNKINKRTAKSAIFDKEMARLDALEFTYDDTL